MLIILIGPPASGKGTLGRKLSATLNIPHIESGDILRQRAKKQDALAQQLAHIMARGDLPCEETVFELVKERLEQKDCASGYILDGFPRTIEQAQRLKSYLKGNSQKVDHALSLDVPQEDLIKRMQKRAGTGTEKRSDDNLTSFFNRLNHYKVRTFPLNTFYAQEETLRLIDGAGNPDQTFAKALNAIQSPAAPHAAASAQSSTPENAKAPAAAKASYKP